MPGFRKTGVTTRSGDQRWIGSRHALDTARTATVNVSAFTPGTHFPNGYLPSGLPVDASDPANVRPWTASAAADEVQTVTVSGAPTGGSFTLTFAGQTTAAIAFNATAAAVQAALEALSNINAGDITVTGAAGGPYTVTFVSGLGGRDVAQLTATSSLTGGTAPAIAVATTTGGAGAVLRFIKDNHQVVEDGGSAAELQVALLWHGLIIEEYLPVPFTIPAAELRGGFVFQGAGA